MLLKAPAGVRLSVEGRTIPRTAIEETFRTPDLEPGYAYTYSFRAEVVVEGRPVAYTKSIRVQAGETTEADFTKLTTEGKDVARVTVKLPADARLYVDNVVCPLSSDTRTFNTPELEVGRSYFYTLKAEVIRDGETAHPQHARGRGSRQGCDGRIQGSARADCRPLIRSSIPACGASKGSLCSRRRLANSALIASPAQRVYSH